MLLILIDYADNIVSFGLRFFFYSEEHLPMHVHVKNGDGKAKMMKAWKEYFDED